MKLLCMSDIHIRPTAPINRKDDYVEAQFEKLNSIIDYANEIEACVVVAGDLLDKATLPYWLLNRLIETLNRLKEQWFVIPGNHDQIGNATHTQREGALFTLKLALPGKLILPFNTFSWNHGDTFLHLLPFGCKPDFHDTRPGMKNVLVTHESVYDKVVPFYMDQALTIDQIEAKYPEMDFIISGDIHSRAIRSKTIVTGSMMRMTITQKDFNPGVVELDTTTGSTEIHHFDVSHDVWKDTVEVAEDGTYKAELQDLVQGMLARDERLDYPATCRQLAAGKPEYEDKIQSIITQYYEDKKR